MGTIYAIINDTTGAAYIGSTKRDPTQRWQQHLLMLKRRQHPSVILQIAYDEVGESHFSLKILETVESDDLLKEKEAYWMDQFPKRYNQITSKKKGPPKKRKMVHIEFEKDDYSTLQKIADESQRTLKRQIEYIVLQSLREEAQDNKA